MTAGLNLTRPNALAFKIQNQTTKKTRKDDFWTVKGTFGHFPMWLFPPREIRRNASPSCLRYKRLQRCCDVFKTNHCT